MDERGGPLPGLGQLEAPAVVLVAGNKPVEKKPLDLHRYGVLREAGVELGGVAIEADDDVSARWNRVASASRQEKGEDARCEERRPEGNGFGEIRLDQFQARTGDGRGRAWTGEVFRGTCHTLRIPSNKEALPLVYSQKTRDYHLMRQAAEN